MTSISRTIYLSADVGVPTDVPPAGSSLENPYVYDSVARELKAMADEGLLQVVSEDRRQGVPTSRPRAPRAPTSLRHQACTLPIAAGSTCDPAGISCIRPTSGAVAQSFVARLRKSGSISAPDQHGV